MFGLRKAQVLSRRFGWAASLLSTAIFAVLIALPANAQSVLIVEYNFENGTQGWSSFNYATIQGTSTVAYQSGTQSLLTTTNSSGAGGPGIDVTSLLPPGGTYSITGYVMLTSGEASTYANFTMKRTDPACSGTCYDTIGTYQVPVSASDWSLIGGSYTVSPTATDLLLYAQLVGPTSAQSFYLDYVVIDEISPPPGGTPIATYTFASGVEGWQPFGSVNLASTLSPFADPKGNTYSLLTTNRTATYMGPSLELLTVPNLVAGATYQVSLYVLLAAPDSSNPTVTISTKRVDCANPSGTYSNLATSGALSSTTWTQVQGTFSFSNIPGAPSQLILYIQSSSATDSFYISDVVIGELVPPPPSPSQQDNTGISTNFEDGGLDGWSSRSGQSTLTNVTSPAYMSTNSLLITGRIANWDGPQISVSNKMYNGSRYSVSVWVMLTPADGSAHVMNISLQTTLSGNTSYPSVTPYPGVTILADGSWHEISVPAYNMANSYDPGKAYLYLQTVPPSGNDLVSFYIDDFQLAYIPPPTIQTDIPSIFQTLSAYFPVGAAVDPTDDSGPHEQLLAKHFNSLTSENDMKWSSVESSLGNFNFGAADIEVGVAVCNGMLVRGQNLVWSTGAQTPSYAFGDSTNSPANQATVTANIQEHIKGEVTHFGTKVYAWDVVNEPIDPSQPDCLKHGPFYQVLGKSYIDIALQAARQYAPPGTKLFINEYSTTDSDRLGCLVQVVRDLQERGIPIDGVGHQMHININYPTPAAFAHAVRTLARLGVDQQVTEFDMSVYDAGDNTSNYGAGGGTVPLSIIAQQGYLYSRYFEVFRRLRDHLSGVTFWGMADDDTWLDSFPISRLDMPLPFDTGLQAKPAYWGIVDPTQLPGYGLTFSLTSKTGPLKARVWTITADNPGPGTAYTVQINGFKVKPVLPWGGCRPVVTPPSSLPVLLGDITEGSSVNVSFTIDFGRACRPDDVFVLEMPWSEANGADSHRLVLWDQHP
jgi:endo-1,4-beta-xylanase